METLIVYRKEYEEPLWVLCPDCGKQYENHNDADVQVDDYVSCMTDTGKPERGMIWIWEDCRHGHYVIDPYVDPVILDAKEALKLYPSFKITKCKLQREPIKLQDLEFRKVKLAYILRHVGPTFYDCRATEPKTLEEMTQFIQDPRHNDGTFDPKEDFIMDISEEAALEAGITIGEDLEYDEGNIWNLSLPVDSYGVFTPKVPYPAGYDTSHDGCYNLLKCRSSTGQEFIYLYWGD